MRRPPHLLLIELNPVVRSPVECAPYSSAEIFPQFYRQPNYLKFSFHDDFLIICITISQPLINTNYVVQNY